MSFIKTEIEDVWVIEPNIFKDDRGYFYESFNAETFNKETGLNINFVQDNQSKSNKGVLRGMHYQTGEHAQAKLVRVLQGSVQDVAVDLRKNSPTFGKHFSIILTAENHKQLFVPRGFAHGFLVLEDNTIFAYKCDNFYNKESEGGLIYNDESIAINWELETEDFILSEKDIELPNLENAKRI
ncbi:MAG: dTDP-4-dehydrorhamnose 3,5-epimerase [Chitinophagales bacterium]